MRRIITARQQVEMLTPWRERVARPGLRLPDVRGKLLDSMGLTQNLLRNNHYSWIDSLTPEELATGGLWYPVGHDWGEHVARRTELHPLKIHSLISATSPRRRWISPNLGAESNLGDAYKIASLPPGAVTQLGGLSGNQNLKKASRIRAAADDPDSVMEAFLGHHPDGRPRRPQDSPKTYDFVTTLNNPEHGGAFNYMQQPAVVDVWGGASMLFSRDHYERAKELKRRNGGLLRDYLKYPTKGTGEGLDRPVLDKKTGELKPPSISDVVARVISKGGAYNRMRNAFRAGAHRHGLPFAHIGQAAVWGAISGNQTPTNDPRPDVDIDSIEHPEELYNELWARRASGLVAPKNPGGLAVPFSHVANSKEPLFDEDDDGGIAHGTDEDWGSPEDLAAVIKYVQSLPPGVNPWGLDEDNAGSPKAAPIGGGGVSHGPAGPLYILLPHWDSEACAAIMHSHAARQQGHIAAPVMDDRWGNDVMDAARQGGFTLHDHVGDGPTSGYMVSLYKNAETKLPMQELTADHVRDFVAANAEALARPHHYLGGWLDGGHFYLDVSAHIPELNRATAEAVRNRQLGIYDLNNGRTIDTQEAGYMTGHPSVLGSRNNGQRNAAVSPSAQRRPAAGGRHSASGGWVTAADDPDRLRREARHLDGYTLPGLEG